MSQIRRILAYSYQSNPWLEKAGDNVRIHRVLGDLVENDMEVLALVSSLANDGNYFMVRDRVYYLSF